MVPTFPAAEKLAYEWLQQELRFRISRNMGVFSESPSRRIKEGDSSSLVRKDDSEIEIDYHKVSAHTSWEKDVRDHLTLNDVFEQIDEIARQMAIQQQVIIFKELGKQLPAQQVIDASNREFDLDLLEEAWSKIQIDFDKDNKPIIPSFIGSPEIVDRLRSQLSQIECDPNASRRMSDLIEKKRREFNARKADRRLVG